MKPIIERPRAGSAWLIAALLFSGTVPATDPETEPPGESSSMSLSESARQQMDRLRAQIKNARIRLTHSISGMDSGSAEKPMTPARRCCSNNLMRIRTALDELGRLFGEVSTCYDEHGNDDGISSLAFAGQDVDTLRRAAANFETASKTSDAGLGVAAMTRSFIQLQESIESLQDCPPDPPPESQKKSGKRKKKKNDG